MILCDTSVLSHFFRRSSGADSVVMEEVNRLIESDQVALLGIVRQELLSGIKYIQHFERIQSATRALTIYLAEETDHIMAARFFNSCREKGVQGSPIDFLIAAMAVRLKFKIYTTDPDFTHYETIIPIELHHP